MDWYSEEDSDGGYGYDNEDNIDSDDDDIAVVGNASSSVVHKGGGSTSRHSDKNYTILNEDEIQSRQNEDINHISSVLSLSPAEATLLLCQYDWNVEKLHEDWFADEFTVRKKVGLLINNYDDSSSCNSNKECGVCFDEFDECEMRWLSCGHRFCVTCWKGYISTNIAESGSGALSLKCQEFKCGAAVTRDLINEFASEEEKVKYDRYLVRSYVESRKEKTKWCPAAGCKYAVEYERDGGGFGYDVTCACSFSYCWNCVEEPHRPVDCKLVEKWILKNLSEAENTTWILAYSKPCPKCKRPIEKNGGCIHMTCGQPCKFEFCWYCLASWKSSHVCNGYVKKKVDEDELIKERAKMSLQRYAHYYERWASNHKSRQKAIEDLHRVETDELTKLSDIVRTPTVQLNFIVEGWKQIIECRRVLKWTYAYGYYLEEHEPVKKQFFEYLQGQAENCLERLHACAEREMLPFLKNGAAAQHMPEQLVDKMELDFNAYRTKLVALTKVTGTHFEELVRALENGLSDVVVQASASTAAPSCSKAKGQKRKVSNSSSRQPIVAINFDMDYGDFWCCDRCTYRNPVDATACQMCYDGQ